MRHYECYSLFTFWRSGIRTDMSLLTEINYFTVRSLLYFFHHPIVESLSKLVIETRCNLYSLTFFKLLSLKIILKKRSSRVLPGKRLFYTSSGTRNTFPGCLLQFKNLSHQHTTRYMYRDDSLIQIRCNRRRLISKISRFRSRGRCMRNAKG